MELKFYNPQGIVKKLTKAEYKFVKFMKKAPTPITQKAIISYWRNEVCRWEQKEDRKYCKQQKCYVWYNRPYTTKEMETLANMWFDRWMGKFFRLEMMGEMNFLNGDNVKRLTSEIKQEVIYHHDSM